jgi:membrane protein
MRYPARMQDAKTTLMEDLRRRIARVDRERLVHFGRFLLRRFLDDRCFESAGALAYTTVFALLPFTAVVMALLSAFPAFEASRKEVIHFVFLNFVPPSARGYEAKLTDFALTAQSLTAPGVIALVVSILLTMWSIEQAFNRIWRVPSAPPKLVRFLMYWTLLTLGSLLTVATLTATSALFSVPELAGIEARDFGERLLRYLPELLELLAFTAAYWLIPHRTIRLRFALVGGLLAMLLFEGLKWSLAIYLRGASFQQLYGAMAVVPILLVWVYFSWLAVLFGASLAASLGSFRYQPRALRLSAGAELYGLLRLLGRFDEARRSGLGLHLAEIQQREPGLTDELLQSMISALCEMNIIQRGESGAWLLSRDLASVKLEELYVTMQLRIPVGEVCLPQRYDAIGRSAQRVLEELREPLRTPLSRDIASLLEAAPTPPPAKDLS